MSRLEGSGVGFVGLGACLPEEVRGNDFWSGERLTRHVARAPRDIAGAIDEAVRTRPADVDAEVARATVAWADDPFRGTRERRVIAADQESSDLEVAACRDALSDAGLSPADIDLYMGYSQVPDRPSPANHGRVHDRLGLPRTAAAFTLDAGCASFLPQLTTATHLIRAEEYRTALLTVSSAVSRITDYDDPVSVNIGDGAVAGVVSRVDPGYGFVAQVQLTRGDLWGGIALAPPSRRDVRWYESEEGLLTGNADRNATHVMGANAASLCREVCEALFQKAGISSGDIDFFVCAQATAWFTDALCDAVAIDRSRALPVADHFSRFAHLVPASMPLNLLLAHRLGRLRRGDLVLMYSPGAGFTQSAVLYRWNLAPPRAGTPKGS